MIKRIVFLAALFAALPSHAQWGGEVAAGYLATSGNTSTQSLNGKLGVDYNAERWKNSFKALGVYSKDTGVTSAERYAASDQLNLKFGGDLRNYVFAAAEWEKDLFGGVRQRVSETIGYGRNVLVGPVHLLDLEVGVGARQEIEQGTREHNNDLIGRFSGLYTFKISETSQFSEGVKVEAGDSNTFMESLSELKMSIIGNLFASLSYTVRHNTDVAPGTDKTDSFTAINLSYNFGG